MKKSSKALCIILTVLVAASVFASSFSVFALERGEVADGVEWIYNPENHAFLISGSGEIPDYDSADDTPWSEYRDAIRTLGIKDGITYVGSYAFSECRNVTKINMGNTVEGIGDHGFYNCYSATEIIFSEALKNVGDCAFTDCAAAEALNLPEGLLTIGEFAFRGWRTIKTVTVPASVTEIGKSAFMNCTGLRSITVLADDAEIGETCMGFNYDGTQSSRQGSFTLIGNKDSAIQSYANKNVFAFKKYNPDGASSQVNKRSVYGIIILVIIIVLAAVILFSLTGNMKNRRKKKLSKKNASPKA